MSFRQEDVHRVPCFRGAITGAFEQGDQFSFLVGGPDFIESGLVTEMKLPGLDGELVINTGGAGKGNGDVQGDGENAMGVAGEGKSRVGGGEEYPAMYGLETVDHVFGDAIVELTISCRAFIDLQAQPL